MSQRRTAYRTRFAVPDLAAPEPTQIDGLTLYHGDCLDVMPALPTESVDLVVTSPPFNVGVDYGDGKDADFIGHKRYHDFAVAVMRELARVVETGGRICLEIGGSGNNNRSSWTWQDAAYESGLDLFSEIVIEHRKSKACAWGSWMSADNVFTIPNFHLLYVFYKVNREKLGSATSIEKAQFVEWTRGRWSIHWEPHNGHPASFPSDIPMRCMRLFGHVDDVVLDPFLGSGTTLMQAKRLGRKGIGIEKSQEYFELSCRNLSQMVLPRPSRNYSKRYPKQYAQRSKNQKPPPI